MRRPERSPLKIAITAGVFIALALLLVVASTQIGLDRRFFLLVLLVLLGIFVLVQMVRRNPQNKQEVKDESETCIPILNAYKKSKSVTTFINDYRDWSRGEHSTYTRMHFGEQVINELRDAGHYKEALDMLYEMGNLPFKAREHYDYDKYRSSCEAELLLSLETLAQPQKTET